MSKRVIYNGFDDERSLVIDYLHHTHQWDPVFILGEKYSRDGALKNYKNAVFEDLMELRLGYFDYSRIGQWVPVDNKIIRTLAKYEGACFDLIEDSTGWNFSSAERRRFYYDTLRYWNTVIHHLKPDIFICWTTPHVFTSYVLYLLCKYYYDIPTVFSDAGPYLENYSAVHDNFENLPSIFEDVYNSSQELELSTKSKEYLASIRAKGSKDPKHIVDMNIYEKYNYSLAFIRFLKRLPFIFKKQHVAWKCNKSPWGQPKSQMSYPGFEFWEMMLMIKNEMLYKLYSSYVKAPDLNKKFILFPASYQPEATTCPQAWPYDDLLLILELLSASVPEDWIIYYKEYPKKHLLTYHKLSLWRNKQYYERIAMLKNVQMIPSEMNIFDLMDTAQAVATPTGTVGWEALVRGKPVLIFGTVWYGGCHSIFKIDSYQDCLDAIKKIINGYKPDQADVDRYAAAIEQSSHQLFIHRDFKRSLENCGDKKYEMERIGKAFYDSYEQNDRKKKQVGMVLKENNLSIGFHRSAKLFPQRPALDVNNEVFSYEQLAAMAGTLSRKIKEFKEENQKLVAILAYRSSTAYAGLLGVLSAGCGYVPLHPEFPKERNFKVLELSRTDIMIVGRECQDALDALLALISQSMTFILVDFDKGEEYCKKYPAQHFTMVKDLNGSNFGAPQDIEPVAKDDIAYLLFTSGSTGEPKGVPVSHLNVRSYIEYITKRYDLNEHDRCSQMHDMTFDFSIHDIYPTWEVGACLCVATKQDKLLPVNFIQKSKLTSWASVPSIAVIIDQYGRLGPGVFPSLRYSFFCGEALYVSTAEKWQKAAPLSKIINLYGPTETTMAISCYDWVAQEPSKNCMNGIVPIGWIFEGNMGRVTRDDEQEADIDEAGELCLSGLQVTKGYWKNPKQTGLQYVVFPDAGDMLWYRTGDLVRLGKDKCLYYLGRIDSQVKILGNRVELGEIDKVLREACGAELAVCVPLLISAGNASSVVAFISGSKVQDEKIILEFCHNKLPKYMVPSKVRFIEQIPMNQNGKVDRLQLQQLLEAGNV